MNGKPDTAAAGPAPSFGAELLRCWRELPNKGFFFCLLAAWLLLFQFLGSSTFGYVDTASLPGWMVNAYRDGVGEEAEEHGFLVPLVVLALFYWKRKELLALPHRIWPPALLLLALASGLHVVGYLVQQPRLSIVAMFLGIYALMGLAWGPGWLRKSFFPFFLFAFCIPVASIAQPLTFPMRIMVSRIVAACSQVLDIDVVREGTQLFNAQHTYRYEVAAPCSGMHSLMAILCIATIYGFVAFEKNWKRLLLIASAFPLSVLGNVVRMMSIIVAAEVSGQSAGNYIHESTFFSLAPYLPAMAGLMLLGHWLRKRPEETLLPLKPNPV
jgi:exosortase